ncbi:MAG: long-chain fatty acid--CoA ligase [Candidatus Aminicenantes bacterium]|nr:long-chain fatty acid--CoA ligase [Candidatus Aminicenantes bacterium]
MSKLEHSSEAQPDLSTISRLFLNLIRAYPKDSLVSYKKDGRYVSISTAEFGERVKHFTLGLQSLGLAKGDKLVILADNGPNWITADYACLCQGMATVPIYTSLVAEQVQYIINDSDAKAVVCSNPALWEKIVAVKNRLASVKHFIYSGPENPPAGTIPMARVMDAGREAAAKDPGLFERLALAVRPDDLASIVYTSGTTGVPKGVLLSHSNFASNINTLAAIIEFTPKDTNMSFLPLSHVLERMVTLAFMSRGTSIAYAVSPETVAENLVEVKPTIMVSVPRLFEKIYARIMDTVLQGSGLKKKIFFWALGVGKTCGRLKLAGRRPGAWLNFRRRIAHKLVFSKILEKTGGRIRFFVSGGAPLSKDIAEFFFAMGVWVLEGYGLTESAPVIACNTFENIRFGTVGKVIPGVEVKIEADGEIIARGPNIMRGYYKKPAETAEALKRGWLYTGDIGHLDPDGYLVITDRKKDLIITSGGKNIAPQPIENMLKQSPYIVNAVIVGGTRKFISALVVPDFDRLEGYAKKNGIAFKTRAELVKMPRVVDFLTQETERSTPFLAPYEKVKKILVLDKDFDIDSGEITPTLKVKRNIIETKYKDLIDSLYID